MLPYSTDALLELLAAYNTAIWPAQITAYLLNLLLLGLLLWPRPGSDRGVASILALGWAWTGFVYLGSHLSALNWGATPFGIVFGVQAFLLFWSGTIHDRLRFRGDRSAASWLGLALIVFALFVYPAVPLINGQDAAAVQYAGLGPVPTVILTMGVLLLAADRTPVHLFLIPVVWSIADGATAWSLDLHWDLSLPGAGLLAVFFAILRPRQ